VIAEFALTALFCAPLFAAAAVRRVVDGRWDS
jgi:hypothetical protein